MNRTALIVFLCCSCIHSFCIAGAEKNQRSTQQVSFSRDIQPLLAKHCLICHGPNKAEGGLRLDVPEKSTAKLDSGERAIIPGHPERSELLRRVSTADESEQMPPDDTSLTKSEVKLLRQWIQDGAPYEKHWSYRPVNAPVPPEVKQESWIRNPIDRFVLAGLEKMQLTPSPEAARPTLIKRLYYDLIGLPPSPDEVDAFLNNSRPDAYERLVDHLLKSEHFGERWGRHWLDQARYADSDGYEKDNPRPEAWRYRDWVIEAINNDMPFDQFTIEQLAGDLLPEATTTQKLATAFHRQTLTNSEGGTDPEEFRVEATFDRAETTAAVWMGLTMTCARCHSHKYDQISHREYFQFYSFFNNSSEAKLSIPQSETAMEQYHQAKQTYESNLEQLQVRFSVKLAELQTVLKDQDIINRSIQKKTENGSQQADRAGSGSLKQTAAPENVIQALLVNAAKRSGKQKTIIQDYLISLDPEAAALSKELIELKKSRPQPPLVDIQVMAKEDRETRILNRGDFLQPGEPVQSDVLAVILQSHPLPQRSREKPADRLDLARWLVDPNHPLTPRVKVNHVWDHLFGRGLVSTVNDFGVRGEIPTHPLLLDWLAWSFSHDMRGSRKQLIKQIVLSATYRQSSRVRPEIAVIDPENKLLSRQNRFRVEAEIIRDLCLAVSGLLSEKVGGPSVFPPLPSGVTELSYNNNFKWRTSQGESRYRRGMYTFFKRTSPYPTLMSFDCPDSNTTRLKRENSNTPIQALVTLNNAVFLEAAQAMAKRVLNEKQGTDAERLAYALRLSLTRQSEKEEVTHFLQLLNTAREYYQAHPQDADQLVKQHPVPTVDGAELAAWITTLRMVLNLDEFLVRS